MFRINFIRKDSEVQAKIETMIDGAGDWTYTFKFPERDNAVAQLTVNQFQQAMEAALKRMKQEWYDKGWTEAKAKKGSKREWFGGYW